MRVELTHVERSIDAYANANTRWEKRSWVEVTLWDDAERKGTGIAAPLPGYSDETLGDVESELERFCEFVSQQSFSTEFVARALRKTPVMLPSSRFAIEMATLELSARREGQSVDALLAERVKRQGTTRVRYARWIQEHEPPERAVGVRAVKLKIGKSLQEELQRVASVRARNPEAEIRVDANRSLDPAIVTDVAGAFAHMGVRYLEEPCDPEFLLNLPKLPMGLAFDETLSEPRAFALLKELTQVHTIQALSIKPTRLGDLRNIFFWCDNALGWGADPVISHCLEPDRAFAGLLALASFYPDAVHGLGSHAVLERDYPEEDGAFVSEADASWLE